VLVNLRLGRGEGILLATLFLAQLVVQQIRLEVTAIYLALAAVGHVLHRRALIPALRTGLGLKER